MPSSSDSATVTSKHPSSPSRPTAPANVTSSGVAFRRRQFDNEVSDACRSSVGGANRTSGGCEASVGDILVRRAYVQPDSPLPSSFNLVFGKLTTGPVDLVLLLLLLLEPGGFPKDSSCPWRLCWALWAAFGRVTVHRWWLTPRSPSRGRTTPSTCALAITFLLWWPAFPARQTARENPGLVALGLVNKLAERRSGCSKWAWCSPSRLRCSTNGRALEVVAESEVPSVLLGPVEAIAHAPAFGNASAKMRLNPSLQVRHDIGMS